MRKGWGGNGRDISEFIFKNIVHTLIAIYTLIIYHIYISIIHRVWGGVD